MQYSDVWAIGVITYFLLCGYTPFDRESNLEEMQAILVADYSFTPLEYWRGVSLQARQFIKRCLTIDPQSRMTAHEALSHAWIAGPANTRGGEDLLPIVKKNFNARRTLHKAIDTVRAINQLRAGQMGMMDGATSREPSRHTASKSSRDGDGDVKMGGNEHNDSRSNDSRSNGVGQTDDQIQAQERKIKEATHNMWSKKDSSAAVAGGNQ